jgi:nucleotide-binding universal stress UspA family protein
MSKSLVCGVDLGPHGASVGDVAAQFGRDLGLGLCLVHAYGGAPVAPEGGTHGAITLADRLERQHDELLVALASERARIEQRGGRVSSARLVVGHPYEVLVQEARALEARYLVVGRHARGSGVAAVLERFLGSTADAVLRQAPCPVLVASGGGLAPLQGRVLLVGIDGEAASLRALTETMEIAAAASASVEAIYVGDDASVVDRAAAHARAHASSSHLAGVLTGVRQTARDGALASTLLEMVRRTNAALLSVGTHGRAGLGHALLGSVAEELCRSATTPVLVTRAQGGRH